MLSDLYFFCKYLLTTSTNLHGPKMDIPFNLADLIPGGAQPPIARLENKKLLHHWSRKLRRQPRSILFEKAIDLLGQLSAEAQSLKRPVTSFDLFADASDDQALYLLWEMKPSSASAASNGHPPIDTNAEGNNNKNTDKGPGPCSSTSSADDNASEGSLLLGYLKVVRDRRLYLVDNHGRRYVHTPLCVLDFFVHSAAQHQGKGVELFNKMLESEQVEAAKCAFDRPSPALLQFLDRHFGLGQPIWQSTAIVVFPKIFDGIQPEGKVGRNEGMGQMEEEERPMTAKERNRRSINQHYMATPPTAAAVRGAHSPRSAERDLAGQIIHGTTELPARNPAGPNTPQGRKVTRDYGHQQIW